MLPILPALDLAQRAFHPIGRVRSRLIMLVFLVAAYVGLVLYDLIRGPLALRAMRPSSAVAKRMILVGAGDAIPHEMARFLDATRVALEGVGFNHLALLRAEGSPGFVALASDAAGVLATAIVLPTKRDELHELVGFTTRLVSGARVRTSNAGLETPWPPRAGDDVVRLPEGDLVRLHAMHRARVAKHVAKGARIAPIVVSDPVAYQLEEERESLERAVASGYFLVEGAEKRHTWKGACLNAWRRSHPFRELREWMVGRAHRSLLRQIGVGA